MEEEAEDILRRRRAPRAPEVVALIHRINPTAEQLPREVHQRRYALKSRLQSLLIREFRADLQVEPVAGKEGVVGLRYRPQDRDACHAVVAELDEDARSWVRLTLDLGPSASEPPTRSAARPSHQALPEKAGVAKDPLELLRQGREAIEAYDFEQARDLLGRAFDASRGAESAALTLITFLVEQLAAYSDALALEEQLSPAAMKSGAIRGQLAFAAAQLNRLADAWKWVDRIEDAVLAAAPLASVASAALAVNDLDLAGMALLRAKELRATHPDLVALASEHARRRAEARQPKEAALKSIAERGDDAATEREAQAVLLQWPDSALAGRLLREIGARRRRAEGERERQAGEAAFAAGDFAKAALAFRRAEALGLEGLGARIAEADRADENASLDRRVAALAARLRSGIDATALTEYAALPTDRRAQLREAAGVPPLEWFDTVAPGTRVDAAIDAVLALLEASTDPSPGHQLELLHPHQSSLRKVPHAQQLLQTARARLDEEARQREERTRQRDAEAAAQERRTELARRRETFEALLEQGEVLKAHSLARLHASDADPEEAAHWKGRQVESEPKARAALRLEAHRTLRREPCPEIVAAEGFRTDLDLGLSTDGQTLYAVSEQHEWLFIEAVDVATGGLRERVALKPPDRLFGPEITQVADSIFIWGGHAALLELSARDWSVLSWHAGTEGDESIDKVLMLPGTRFLWSYTSGRDAEIQVIDLARNRIHRTIRDAMSPVLFSGPDGPRALSPGLLREGRVFGAAGNLEFTVPDMVRQLAPASDGSGWVALCSENEWGGKFHLQLLDRQGHERSALELPHPEAQRAEGLATSSETGLTYLARAVEKKEAWLSCFKADSGGLKSVWEVPINRRSYLAQDCDGRSVVLVSPGLTGPGLFRLGIDPPAVHPESTLPPPQWFDPYCGGIWGDAKLGELMMDFRRSPPGLRQARFEAIRDRYENDLESLYDFCRSLKNEHFDEWAREIALLIQERFPGDPLLSLESASDALRKGDWELAIRLAKQLDLEDLDDRRRAHLHHLEARAELGRGDLAASIAPFERAASVAGDPCEVAGWAPWLSALRVGSAQSAPPLLAAIFEADACLGRGDGPGALRALDTPLVWRSLEIQLATRLAKAVLLAPEPNDAAATRKRFILATFLDQARWAEHSKRGLVLGSFGWTSEQIARVAAEAKAWFGET